MRGLVILGMLGALILMGSWAGEDGRESAPPPTEIGLRPTVTPFYREPTPTPFGRPKPTQRPRTKCEPSYPTVCIPPGLPPNSGCSITAERNFKVLRPDPYGLDGDGDGIGCEPVPLQPSRPAPDVPPAPPPPPSNPGNCEPAYMGCIPVSPYGDWQCGDIRSMGLAPVYVREIGWDPYNLDGDLDGVGCE